MTATTTPVTPDTPDGTDSTHSADSTHGTQVPDRPAGPGAADAAPPPPTPAREPRPHVATTAQGRQALGAYGERVAARHLEERGLLVLDRNWRCEEGEIDLVLRDGSVLVICEVKTRTSVEFGTPHEAVDDTKLDRLRRLASRWAEANDVHPPEVRIDLVAVLRPPKGAADIDYVRGIG